MRYAYAITTALLLGGAASSLVLQHPAYAQSAQNEPGTIASAAPKPGAPMSFAEMVAKLQPAVVNVSTKQKVQVSTADNPLMQLFGGDPNGGGDGQPVTREGQSLGSGFIISPDGYIVTNAHVVNAAARGAKVESITITLANRKEYVARLVGSDTSSDLALLKVDATNLPYVKFGDSQAARVGDWVIAIGNPFGLGGTVTAGIISALHRVTGQGGAYDRFIQTDAAINKGNSGGPMFDLNGNVIGINSQIYSPSEGSVGIGFAIPAESAKPIIDTMMKGGKIQRGYLGVGRQPIDEDIAASLGLPKDKGELIGRVEPGQAADKAGIKQGDVILAVNGKEVNPDETLSYLVANLAPGSTARLSVVRDGKPLTINAIIGTRPTEEELANLVPGGAPDGSGNGTPGAPELRASTDLLGLQVTGLTPGIANNLGIPPGSVSGVVVTKVDTSSDAATKIQPGDIISSVNRVAINTPAQLAAQINAAKAAGRNTVLLYITRVRQGSIYIAVKLKS
ncbi:Do family serine endopeptidase [Sphingomonas panacisoli]|uniref:Probable periplasmic serine endoprotease DegP-like n=1 Tax=Sphingomonas panacisoli TaxID=1813879 RepID=A0A5B8LF38_9SPHN|nr:Do family serine endopeptidase [Sphingomonas panacisoli]QDZ06683.1 Do family serine endopeptidase [Sphingomonas panacisoli]